MSYESPINMYISEAKIQMEKRYGEMVYKAVHDVGIHVEEPELKKALKYDRDQYDKGYRDGEWDARNPKWIPCSERLPEESQKVLACNITGFICIAQCYGEDRWYEDGGFGRIYIDAWMPLPDPYREDGDSDD